MSFAHKELLEPPVSRAAYSDRTAWLMSELARLAYEKFESKPELLDELANKVSALTDKTKIKEEFERFFNTYLAPDDVGLQGLNTSLTDAKFELVQSFNNGGTQAFLAKRDSDKIAVLAFRGTEMNYKDIKTDLNARFYKRNGEKIHDGFLKAYRYVESAVEVSLEQLKDYKIYITGHSLGGALAIIAAKELSSDQLAACYTFGSPRVGNEEFGYSIKVPIYRIINDVDIVPRVPPSWFIDLVIFLTKWGLAFIPKIREPLLAFLRQFQGYRHQGDMRYLTACKDDFSDLHLIANPPFFDRVYWWIIRHVTDFKAGFHDHSIAKYCEKLEAYGLKRIKQK